jgi:cobalt/nickel transport system permease protein
MEWLKWKSGHQFNRYCRGRDLLELYSPKTSTVHRLDARVKALFTLAFLIFLSLTPSGAWPAYIFFFAFILSASLYARMDMIVLFKRSLIAIPFVLAALPLIFFGPLPRQEIALSFWGHVVYSPAGVTRFFSIAIKSWISLQAAILLTATTRFSDLLAAFHQLKTPAILVAIVGLMWRYLALIQGEAVRMMRARASRTTTIKGIKSPGGSVIWRAKVTGGMAGSLFLRSLERSDRVYAAMRSRGYNGNPPVNISEPIPNRDLFVLFTGTSIIVLLWVIGFLSGG